MMFCIPQNLTFPNSDCFLYYYAPYYDILQHPSTFPVPSSQFAQVQMQRVISHVSNDSNQPSKVSKGQAQESLFPTETKLMSQKKNEGRKNSLKIYGADDLKTKEIKLDFRIQWKNENRNIVPNLTHQMISFVLKKSKSQPLVKKLFQTLSPDERWTLKKFYLYMKKIKQSITHYVNQNAILKFLEIHEPKCQLYEYEQQLFYMRICRLLIMKFLENEAILVSLTSNRMSSAKRLIHLIARDALKRKFLQLCKLHML